MAAPKCTDAEVIAAYRELQSTLAVAARLGMAGASVRARRARIEKRLGIKLPQFDERPAYNRVEIAQKAIAKMAIDTGTALIGSDAHIWPGALTTMQRAFIEFARNLKPTLVIANGDFFDGSQLSRFPSIGWESVPSVKDELEAVQDYMDKVVKASPSSRRFWPAGNHDLRFESRIANVAPEYRGVRGVHLKDHFPEWIPCWRVDINDNVVVRHRELGGEHADFRNPVVSGVTMVTGHDHRGGWVAYDDYTGRRYGVRCGFMADSPTDPQFLNYLEAKQPNWQPAFVLLSWHQGRLLQPEMIYKWDDDHVEFRGSLVKV